MAQVGRLVTVTTDKDLQFTDALAQNAEERENVVLPAGISADYGNCVSVIRSIAILSDQNLDWELFFWGRNTFGSPTDFDLNSFIGKWRFDMGDGEQIAAAGGYYYYIDGLYIPYRDLDQSSQLHVSLVNRNAIAKLAGATGEIVVKLRLEVELGW